jgi:microcin C transport system substrate-binding protein
MQKHSLWLIRRRAVARRLRRALAAIGLGLSLLPATAAADGHGLALYGEPAYASDFTQFAYVNPDAPKGGSIRLAAIGTFDNLNGFILRGNPATGLFRLYDTLTVPAADEPFSVYGLLAERITVSPERDWVRFQLREQARFHDGVPVTAADVVFSFELLMAQGHPNYRLYYADILAAEAEDRLTVRFDLGDPGNRELALIIGQLPVLPAHYWAERTFNRTTLEPPLGSGPYRVERVEAGRQITYRRVDDYWGADLPVNRGRYNLDRIRIDYYRDMDVAVEAVKAGAYDLRVENVARNWAMAYDTPAVREGRLRRIEIAHDEPTGMQGFVLNTRRPQLADPRVREALGYAFDFESTSEALFHGAYARTESYFSNSELAARGEPSAGELAVLEAFRAQLPAAVFGPAWQAPRSDGPQGLRGNLRRALQLLAEAGWEIRDGRLIDTATGTPMELSFLMNDQTFNRVIARYQPNLERLGIATHIRVVDDSQYINRMREFDFDITVLVLPQSRSPGNEQRSFWTCDAADTPGSRNVAGICDPVIDALVAQLIQADDWESLRDTTRALDRVLIHGHYVVPHWHSRVDRVVYWDRYAYPDQTGIGFDPDLWWQVPGADPGVPDADADPESAPDPDPT